MRGKSGSLVRGGFGGGFKWRPLNELGWRIVFSLSGKPNTRVGLARELQKPASRVSEAVGLFPAGVCFGRAGKPLVLNVELSGVARGLRLKHPNLSLPKELAGSKLKVLDALNSGFETVDEITWAEGISKATVKRVLNRLQKTLLAFQPKKGRYAIRRGEEELRKACVMMRSLAFQASGLNEQLEWIGKTGFQPPGAIELHGRMVLCKNMKPLSKAFQLTGLSLFPKYGVEFVSEGSVECVFQDHLVTKEEAFVHAIALNASDNRVLGFCMLFLLKNKLDLKQAERLARYFKCERAAERMLKLLESRLVDENNFLDFDYRGGSVA